MKTWLKRQIGHLARFTAREMADELNRTRAVAETSSVPSIKIDAIHLLRQLNSNEAEHQIIRFFERNHRWIATLSDRNQRTAAMTNDFIDREMPDALFYLDQFAVIERKRDKMLEGGGYILDLGVYKGDSTRRLARIFPDETIHGFGSFEGLPEDWSYVLKGGFGDIAGTLPDMPDNVILYKGWFEDTLPRWKAYHVDRPISILRIDCDIYSSTKTIFDTLGDRLASGSWLVFDELIGYRGWEKHEYKAFTEFIERTGFDYSYVAYGLTYAIVRLNGGGPTPFIDTSQPEPHADGREGLPKETLAAIERLHARFATAPEPARQPPEKPFSGPLEVAVVVPVFNGAAYLADCLESVARQTFEAWRCYIVDDASSDGTSGIAEAFAARDDRFVALRHGRNAGLSAARNTGLVHAEEPLVTFLDADDMLTPSSLERRAGVMRDRWHDRAVAGSWGSTSAVRQDASLADAAALDKDTSRRPAIHAGSNHGECPFNVHAPLLRTALLRRLGGFDERLRRGGEDWDLWHRLLRHGYTLEHAGGTTGLYRRHRGSMTTGDPEGHLDESFRLLAVSEKAALVDESLSVDPYAASPLARTQLAAQWLRRLAQFTGMKLAASGDLEAGEYRDLLGRAPGAPRAMTLDLENHAEAGIRRGLGMGGDECLPAAVAERVAAVAGAVAEDLRGAATRVAPREEEGAATVDCRPSTMEPDVVAVAETAADVRGLAGFVSRLRDREWDAVALDTGYAHGEQGATRAWQRAGVPLVPCNHLLLGRIRPAKLLLCRPFGPATARLAAAVAGDGGAVIEWEGGTAEARLPCNETEATGFDVHWGPDMEVPEKRPGIALGPPPARHSRGKKGRTGNKPATTPSHALDFAREEGPLDAASTAFLESLRDKHRGETVVVIGNGPSLNDTDLGLLAGVATIGVNGIFYAQERLPDPLTYYVVEDTKVFEENIAAIKAFECRYKLFPTLYRDRFEDGEIDRTRMGFFRMNMGFYGRGTGSLCLPRFSTDAAQRLYCGQSVTIINLQLAYWMGFSRAVLIGMDFSYKIPSDAVRKGNLIVSHSDDPNHFHPDYFGKGKTWKDPKLDRVLANYALARDMFAADGREIVNATEGGALQLFRRMPLAEALARAPKRPA